MDAARAAVVGMLVVGCGDDPIPRSRVVDRSTPTLPDPSPTAPVPLAPCGDGDPGCDRDLDTATLASWAGLEFTGAPILVPDATGDGVPDLLLHYGVAIPTVALLAGPGIGTTLPDDAAMVVPGVYEAAPAGDLNGDALVDLVATVDDPDADRHSVYVVLSPFPGDGRADNAIPIGVGFDLKVAEFDGDGEPDLLLRRDGFISVHAGPLLDADGDALLEVYGFSSDDARYDLADLDGDGLPEILFTTRTELAYGGVVRGPAYVVEGGTEGMYYVPQREPAHSDVDLAGLAIVGDQDGDGLVDAAFLDGTTWLVVADGMQGEFDPASLAVTRIDGGLVPPGGSIVPAGDLDGDGAPELLVDGSYETWLVPGGARGAFDLADSAAVVHRAPDQADVYLGPTALDVSGDGVPDWTLSPDDDTVFLVGGWAP